MTHLPFQWRARRLGVARCIAWAVTLFWASSAPAQGLNHLIVHLDGASFDRLSNSPFVRDTLATVRAATVSDGNSTWSALYQFGPQTYIEFFRATAGGPRPGTVDLALGVDSHAEFNALVARLESAAPHKFIRRSRERIVENDTMPWFEQIGPDSAGLERTGVRWWLMAYDPRHNARRWPADGAIAGRTDRASYLKNVRSPDRILGDIDEVTIALEPDRRAVLAGQLTILGFRPATRASGIDLVGSGIVLHLVDPAHGERPGFVSASAPIARTMSTGVRVRGTFELAVGPAGRATLTKRSRCSFEATVVHTPAGPLAACRAGSTGPTVVFESGLGEGLDAWNDVVDSVSRFARAVTYDRAGIGASPRAAKPFSALQVAAAFNGMLDALKIHEPIILVAHSLGAAYAQTFAAEHPARIAALVLVDPTPPGFFQRQRLIVGDSAYAATRARTQGVLGGVALEEWTNIEPSQETALRYAPRAPQRSTVLTAGRVEAVDTLTGRRVKALWTDMHRDLSSRLHARHEIVPDAPHHIQAARPDRVTAAIRSALPRVSPPPQGQIAALAPAQAASSHDFTRISGVRELPNGGLLVGDAGEGRLTLLDRTLVRATTVGRNGTGPLEYLSPFALLGAAADTTLVVDLQAARMLVVSPSGTIAGTRTLAITPSGFAIFPAIRAVDNAGRFYHLGSRSSVRSASTRDSVPLLRRDHRRPAADTIAWIRVPGAAVNAQSRSGTTTMARAQPDPFAWRDDWAVWPDGRVALVRGDSYHLEIIDGGRMLASGPAMRLAPVPVTAEDLRRLAASRSGSGRGPTGFGQSDGSDRPAGSGQVAPPPDAATSRVKPPFVANSASIDQRGRLWVERSRPAGMTTTTYDLFDRSGQHLQSVTVPDRGRVVGFGRDAVYVATSDADDLLRISRHAAPADPAR